MCYGCWEENGKPMIDTPDVRKAAAMIKGIYEYNCMGSNLHVVIDDCNYEDYFINSCMNGLNENVFGATPEQLAIERECLILLKRLSIKERASAIALAEGYWDKGR